MKRLLIILPLVLILLAACNGNERGDDLTTDSRSSTFATDDEKLDFLKRYVRLKSDVTATEFHIWYQDNGGGFPPGPSDWDIRVVMQVPLDQVERWAEGRTPVAGERDLAWGEELAALRPEWELRETPQLYEGDGSLVALFPEEGIVFLRNTTLP